MNEKETYVKSARRKFAVTFLVTFIVAMLVISYIRYMGIEQKYERANRLAHTIGSETYEILLSQMSKIQVLQSFIVQGNGSYEGTEDVAEILLDEKGVRNVLFAPDGIVDFVYPYENNEAVIGLNMYEDGLGNWEARAAIEAKELYMAGPFELLQGGMGIAGRMPIFLKDEAGETYFWGVVSVTLDYPEILSNSSIQYLNDQGYACEIWRIEPTTGEKQVILETDKKVNPNNSAYNYDVSMFHANWTITVAPIRLWYEEISFWVSLLIGIVICFLVALTTYNNEKVRIMEQRESKRQIEHLKSQVEFEQSNMLLSQIRSHFFYHTLNSLQALIVLQPDEAYKMVDDFSRYMRFNLDSITLEDGLCTFKEELRSVKAYTDINQMQLGERLKMNYEIPEIDFNIPVLTIQPIVENAILHGIKPKVGGGTVTVRLEEMEDCMKVTVEDDGVGFEVNEEILNQSVGMKNIRKRLEHFEGCTIHFESKVGVGTKVVLSYPKDL